MCILVCNYCAFGTHTFNRYFLSWHYLSHNNQTNTLQRTTIPTLLDLYEAIKPYTIYCDMDGVLCDFDQGYEKLTGESTDKANAKGKSYFWKLFRESVGKNEKDFWANLPWQPGGEELWNYIKSSSPNILSAPAVDFNLPQDQQLNPEFNQAIQGKKEWISKHLNGVNKEIFVPAPTHKRSIYLVA